MTILFGEFCSCHAGLSEDKLHTLYMTDERVTDTVIKFNETHHYDLPVLVEAFILILFTIYRES